MHIASLLNKGSLIPILLQGGADISIADNKANTAEQLAINKHSDDVLKQFAVLKL
jgi:hypothetical protein